MIVDILQALLSFVLVLGPLVFVHEFGHFIVAKRLGIAVPVFSLGFGPRLWGFRWRETDYRLSAIPLGGYVKLAGDESDETRTGAPEEFLSRPKWQRFLVFVAGAAFNIALAFLTMWGYFALYGKMVVAETYPVVIEVKPDSTAALAGVAPGDRLIEIAGVDVKNPETFWQTYNAEVVLHPGKVKPIVLEREGQRLELELNTGVEAREGQGEPGWSLDSGSPAVVVQVQPGERAEQAGLEAGDVIVAVDGRKDLSYFELRQILSRSPEVALGLGVMRGERYVELTVTPRLDEDKGRIGVTLQPNATHMDLGLRAAAVESVRLNVKMSQTLFLILKRYATRELPLSTMSGPIGIAQYAREAVLAGFDRFLFLLGFFSLQLGILNLLPIPVLDGGHILILGVEGVLRRELSDRVKERVMQAGLVFLLVFMSMIVYLDVTKLI